MKDCDLLVVRAGEVLTTESEERVAGIADGAVAIDRERVIELGSTSELARRWRGRETLDAAGGAVTPAFCDPHTHLVFAGGRAEEFAARVSGAPPPEGASGILATVEATRRATDQALGDLVKERLDAWLRAGVSLVEVKSGYALDVAGELRLLRIAHQAAAGHALEVVGTVLAAHAVPREFEGRTRDYLAEVAWPVAEKAKEQGLAEFVDVFVERGAFTAEEAEPYLVRARAAGYGVRVHAEQLTRSGGAALAARQQAISADHLEHATAEDARSLAGSGTIAVLLPGAVLTLEGRGGRRPPVRELLAAGVPIALGTDFNPGTSTVPSPALSLGLACRLFGLTPAAAWAGFTANAAASLGRGRETGRIAPGYRADLCVWEARSARELAYVLDAHRPRHVVVRGRVAVREGGIVAWPEPKPAAR